MFSSAMFMGAFYIKHGKEIKDVADRFGVFGLKMAVEADLVAYRIIDVSIVVNVLLFAHLKTSPLLKEYAINYFVCLAKDTFNSDFMRKKLESTDVMKDLMEAMANNSDSIAMDYDTDV